MTREPTYSFVPADQVKRKAKHRPHPAELLNISRNHRVEVMLQDEFGRSEPVYIKAGQIVDFRLMGVLDTQPERTSTGLQWGDVLNVPLEAILTVTEYRE
ncbi:hypothetical protein G6N82_06195 [Altererythrobacter sp. BO-6]|uniref:hypothetical protein n=1 Tax=Altererythrobacter sp. BO-6 TaxID=2604537 RepID=UPI0013E1799E|nr:hypothetical protein [Altererythrobacter sp. BO-6]QIG53800.1 hypothetical protein G6N82_06195 [Altererythrobacter sp. BO-6]